MWHNARAERGLGPILATNVYQPMIVLKIDNFSIQNYVQMVAFVIVAIQHYKIQAQGTLIWCDIIGTTVNFCPQCHFQ